MEQCADKTRPIILFKDYVEAEFPFCGVDLTWSYEKIMEFIKSKKNNYKKRIYYIVSPEKPNNPLKQGL
jgi:hypothetical protein